MPLPQLSTIDAINVPASPPSHPAFVVPHSLSISSFLLIRCLSSPRLPHLKPLPTSTHHLVRWRTPQKRATSTSAMHIKLDITSSALAWVCALLDSGLPGFGHIRSVFVCLLIPLIVLDPSFVSLAPTRRLCHQTPTPATPFRLCTRCHISRYHTFFTSPLITRLPFRIQHCVVCHWQHWTSNLFFFFFSLSLLLCVAYTVAPCLRLTV